MLRDVFVCVCVWLVCILGYTAIGVSLRVQLQSQRMVELREKTHMK